MYNPPFKVKNQLRRKSPTRSLLLKEQFLSNPSVCCTKPHEQPAHLLLYQLYEQSISLLYHLYELSGVHLLLYEMYDSNPRAALPSVEPGRGTHQAGQETVEEQRGQRWGGTGRWGPGCPPESPLQVKGAVSPRFSQPCDRLTN